MKDNLKQIMSKPSFVGNIHESIYRSYSLLDHVLLMIDRGDSKETIFEVVDLLKSTTVELKSFKDKKA